MNAQTPSTTTGNTPAASSQLEPGTKLGIGPESGLAAGAGLGKNDTKIPGLWRGIWLICRLEIAQRQRSTKWLAAMITWAVILLSVAVSTLWLSSTVAGIRQAYVACLMFTLAAVLVVCPALSALVINADRADATLAIVQVTPLSAAQILWGKTLGAAWSGIMMVAIAALPITVLSFLDGNRVLDLVAMLLALCVEVLLCVIMGAGCSALAQRPVGAVALSYALVATRTVGLLIVFALLYNPLSVNNEHNVMMRDPEKEFQLVEQYATGKTDDNGNPQVKLPADSPYTLDSMGQPVVCHEGPMSTHYVRTQYIAWLWLFSPPVIFADLHTGILAALERPTQSKMPGQQETSGELGPQFEDLLQGIAYVRAVQQVGSVFKEAAEKQALANKTANRISPWDDCEIRGGKHYALTDLHETTADDANRNTNQQKLAIKASEGRAWPLGLAGNTLLAAAFWIIAWRRLRLPVGKLATGQRIA